MFSKLLGMIVGSSMILFPSISNALIVSESVDFPDFSLVFPTSGLVLGEFSLGSNTVSGSINGSCLAGDLNNFSPCSTGDSGDSFIVTLPSSLLIKSIAITVSNLNVPGNLFVGLILREESSPGSRTSQATRPFISSNSIIDITITPPFEAGTYDFAWSNNGADEIGSFSYDWKVEVNTISSAATVPEPGTLALLGLGLAGLGIVRRRKKPL